MRLLDTHTGFFREFTGPDDPELVRCGGYVILSHTWNRKEDSYQDLLRLQAKAKERAASASAATATWATGSLPDKSDIPDGTPDSEGLASEWAKMCKLWRAINHGSPAPSNSSCNTTRRLSILDDPELSKKIKGLCRTARKAGYRYAWDDTCCIDKMSSAELSQAINSMYEWYGKARRCYVYLADVPDGDDAKKPDSAFARSRCVRRCAPPCVARAASGVRFRAPLTLLNAWRPRPP